MAMLILVLLLAASATPAQEPTGGDDLGTDQEAAEEFLKRLDAKIYYPSRNGLEDFRFRVNLGGTGPFEALNDMAILFAWKHPEKSRLQYVDAEGTPLEEFPDFAKQPQWARHLKEQEQQVRGTAQQHLIGAPLAWIYRDYYKELKRVEVNNKAEYRIIMRPKSRKASRPRHWSKIVVKVVEGLPRTFVKTDENGKTERVYMLYEKRGDKHLVAGLKYERENQLVTEEKYNYVVKKEIYVLSSIERGTTIGPVRKATVKLEGLEVNIGLPDSYFGVTETEK